MQTPTIGRTVLYTLSAEDAAAIEAARSIRPGVKGNPVTPGQRLPATVVAVWPGNLVNLHVFLDGPDTHWALSREQSPINPLGSSRHGTWDWPART